MSVLTKTKPRSPNGDTIQTNDLILDVTGLQMDAKTRKAVDAYIEGCLAFEQNWDNLLQDRQELLDDALNITFGDLINRAEDLIQKLAEMKADFRDLLEARHTLLPLLTPAFEQFVKDSMQAHEDAVKAVGDRFERDGVGISTENAYVVNPGAAKIQFRHRCENEDEVRRVKGILAEAKSRFAGFMTQQKAGDKSRDSVSETLCRWPSITDGGKRRIATILGIL